MDESGTCYRRAAMNHDPAPTGFHVDGSEIDGASLVVLNGELDLASAAQLVQAVSDLGAGSHPVILDLSAVTFVDSSGVRALLDTERIVADKGRRLAFLRPGIAVTRLLELVDLRGRFTEVDAIDEATLAGLQRA